MNLVHYVLLMCVFDWSITSKVCNVEKLQAACHCNQTLSLPTKFPLQHRQSKDAELEAKQRVEENNTDNYTQNDASMQTIIHMPWPCID